MSRVDTYYHPVDPFECHLYCVLADVVPIRLGPYATADRICHALFTNGAALSVDDTRHLFAAIDAMQVNERWVCAC